MTECVTTAPELAAVDGEVEQSQFTGWIIIGVLQEWHMVLLESRQSQGVSF